MKKTLAIVLSLVLALSMVLAGCGGKASAPVSDEPILGTATSGEVVWWGWTPGSPTNEEYIAVFNQYYPDIKVTWKQTTINDYDAAIKPALANGEGVDAMQVSAGSANGGIAIFGGQAIDMEPALKNALGDDYRSKLNPAAIDTMLVDGKLKGLGVGSVYAGNLWINLELFEKYDVKIPTNMDEWKAACETFEANGLIGFVQGAGHLSEDGASANS